MISAAGAARRTMPASASWTHRSGRSWMRFDRLGLSGNTVIVFTSDHGYHTGEHGLWQKMSLFEERHGSPSCSSSPGVSKTGAVATSPVSLVDLYPTLAELCGVKAPPNLQGQSLIPILKDTSVAGRGWAVTQVVRDGRIRRTRADASDDGNGKRFFGYSLRTLRWRYTEWDEGREGRELYDHDADPRELTNLAERSSRAETVERLSAQLRAAVKTTFPPSGKTPELKPGTWAPDLTRP